MASHILKIGLAHIRPPIWRRLRVPSDFTLADLHDVIQIAFGWENTHLHEFRVGKHRYGILDPDGFDEMADETPVTLGDTVPRKGARVEYIYDFGDFWTHNVSIEAIEDAPPSRSTHRLRRPVSTAPLACLDGKRAAPPEDCGGP